MPGLRARKKFYQWQVLHEVSQVRGIRSTGTVPTKSTTIKITDMKKTASSLNTWLNKESKTFSILCGEKFSRAEVIMANAVTVGMIAVAVVAGSVLS